MSQVQMNGVSMGGWLVLEDFLAPEMFKNASKMTPYRSPRIPAGYNANKCARAPCGTCSAPKTLCVTRGTRTLQLSSPYARLLWWTRWLYGMPAS